MKLLFEQMGGAYIQQSDYFLSDLALQPEKERSPVCVASTGALSPGASHHPLYQSENQRSTPLTPQ